MPPIPSGQPNVPAIGRGKMVRRVEDCAIRRGFTHSAEHDKPGRPVVHVPAAQVRGHVLGKIPPRAGIHQQSPFPWG